LKALENSLIGTFKERVLIVYDKRDQKSIKSESFVKNKCPGRKKELYLKRG
jgi:uncharacterized protein YueI